MVHKFFPTVAKQTKPLTKRQLELLVAIAFGEIWAHQNEWQRNRGHWAFIEHNYETGRDVDVSVTIRKIRQMKLVRWNTVHTGGKNDLYIRVTPHGQTIVDDACTDLL